MHSAKDVRLESLKNESVTRKSQVFLVTVGICRVAYRIQITVRKHNFFYSYTRNNLIFLINVDSEDSGVHV